MVTLDVCPIPSPRIPHASRDSPRRITLFMMRVVAPCCALIFLALLVIWETPWGIAKLEPPQNTPLLAAMLVHAAVGLALSIGCIGVRRARGVSSAVPRRVLAFLISFAFISADMLVGILFPPFTVRPPTFLMHPVRGWTNRPNHRSESAGADVLTDDHGLRIDEETGAAGPPDGTPILFVGDSLTFGWGAKYREAFPTRTIALLNARFPNLRLKSLNGGTPGYDTRQECHWLMEAGLPLNPKLVVLQFCLNDLFLQWDPAKSWDDCFLGDFLRPGPPVSWSGIGRALWLAGRMARTGTGLVEEGARIERFGVTECLRPRESQRVANAWQGVLTSMDRIERACRAAGIPMVLVCIPVQIQVDDPAPSTRPQQHLADWARQHEVPYLDVLPLYRRQGPHAARQAMFDLTHPSPAGHEIIARSLADLIEHSDLLMKELSPGHR